MHKSATKCNETLCKWCKNKHGASKIIDTFETYHLLICWRCIVRISIIALPPCLGLFISCYFLEFQEYPAILHCMPWHSFVVDECVVYMAWPIEHVIRWLIVLCWSSWLELLVAARVFYAIVAISWISTVMSLVGVFFVSRGYLTMGAVVIIVAGFSPLIAIHVFSVVFRWPRPFVITSIFAVRESVCYVH
jgi:hypothetical protein